MLNKNFKIVILCCVAMLGLASCEKWDKYNNASNIKTPFSMIVGDEVGTIKSTNDGRVLNTYNFAFGSGYKVKDILVSDSNTLVIRKELMVFKNLPANDWITPFTNNVQNDGFDKMVIDKSTNYVWFCAKDGLYFSTDNGITWSNTGVFSTNDINNNATPLFIVNLKNKPTSIFTTDDQYVYCLQDSFIFRKDPGVGQQFKYVPAIAGISDTVNWWVLTGYQNTLVVFDTTGEVAPHYSTNGGLNWAPYTGLPVDKKVLFVKAPEHNPGRLYCGTDSAGLYELNGTNFVKFNSLNSSTVRYYDIVSKTNTYMSGVKRYYYYLATSEGLYESENSGTDWRLKNSSFGFSALW